MCSWGTFLVLGLGESSDRVTKYLDDSRLDYTHEPLSSRDDFDNISLAFVCVAKESLSVGLDISDRLAKLGIPSLLVAPLEVATGLNALCQFVSFPVTDADLKAAFHRALYGPEANVHNEEMRNYARRLGILTSRERLIAQMAANGETNRRIARVVGLTEKSVERERRRMREKIQARNSAELMRVVTLGSIYEFCDASNQQAKFA